MTEASPTTTTAPAPAANNKYVAYSQVKRQTQQELAANRTQLKRITELMELGVFTVLLIFAIYVSVTLLQSVLPTNTWPIYVLVLLYGFIPFILGMFIADFVTGTIHWACDTWGSVDSWIGRVLLWSFREHHVDAVAMTKHDFVESSADSSIASSIFLVILFGIVRYTSLADTTKLFLLATCIHSGILILATNEFHKYSHMAKPPAFAVVLQKMGLILNRQHHYKHHTYPFDTNYCICNGWMNPILNGIGYWRTVEAIITFVTGAIPRSDDHFWNEKVESTLKETAEAAAAAAATDKAVASEKTAEKPSH